MTGFPTPADPTIPATTLLIVAALAWIAPWAVHLLTRRWA